MDRKANYMFKKRLQELEKDKIISLLYLRIIPIGGIFLFSRFFLIFRDLLVIWTFGVAPEIDTFILAFLLPFNFTNIISLSYINIFIPKFVELRYHESKSGSVIYYSASLFLLLLSSLFATLLLNLLYPYYSNGLTASFQPQDLLLMQRLLWFTSSAAVISSVCNFWREILNVRSKHFQAVATSAIIPIISIILLVFDKKSGVFALAHGLLVGTVIEAVCLYLLLLKDNFNPFPLSEFSMTGTKWIFGDWWKLLLSKTFDNCVSLTDGIMAAAYPQPGSLSSLNYGRKIVWLPIEMACYAFAAISIPILSDLAAMDDWVKFRRTIRNLLFMIFLTTLPVIILIFFFPKEFVVFLYEHGGFNPNNTNLVAVILPYYAIHIPFFIIYYLLIRILPIINKNMAAIFFSFLTLLLTFIFNYWLIIILGVPGIALSSFCVYFIVSMSLFSYIWITVSKKSGN